MKIPECEFINCDNYECENCHIEKIIRPQGKWKETQGVFVTDTAYKIFYRCSECDCIFGYPFNFCPNCGAKMKGGADMRGEKE